MARIFISYRREDTIDLTRHINDRLSSAGHESFMDLTSIIPGANWPEELERQLDLAEIVCVVIGEQWLHSRYSNGRRKIDDPNDWVHKEILSDINRGKRLIPIVVNRGSMPNESDLPPSLLEFARRQAKFITQENWNEGVDALLDSIARDISLPRPTIVLTSISPRRQDLLRMIGWNKGERGEYLSVQASITLPQGQSNLTKSQAEDIAKTTAIKKINYLKLYPNLIHDQLSSVDYQNTIVIGVDTIVLCDGKVLDRPLPSDPELAGPDKCANAKDCARKMLKQQRDKKIYIITGLAVTRLSDSTIPSTKAVVTEAKLRNYSDDEIESYISCLEPLDKAGAFGIQGKGVVLFEWIKGSYTNVVGLPLRELFDLLQEKYGSTFAIPAPKSPLPTLHETLLTKNELVASKDGLSVVCIGDINYDFIYDELPAGFFAKTNAPGKKFIAPIKRAVGGTAVNFAKGARKAGFSSCYVVGVIGGDALGRQIVDELSELGIIPLRLHDPGIQTSIAIIIRDKTETDTSLTLTDAHQSLPTGILPLAQGPIVTSDVFYCSGYALIDTNRQGIALEMLRMAKSCHHVVVLDVVVGMSGELLNTLRQPQQDNHSRFADVVVSELPEIFAWFGISTEENDELTVWEKNKENLVNLLRERLFVAILRTSRYTHEVVVTQKTVDGPSELDYSSLEPSKRTGYGDIRTAKQVHSLLSPRIVLASKSPQRYTLLTQVIDPSKIQVIESKYPEKKVAAEHPKNRVKRLAEQKARSVFNAGRFHDDIEFIIGADTEIFIETPNGGFDLIGHPTTIDEAFEDLSRLNGLSHSAMTGIAIIGKDPATGKLKLVSDVVETKVEFINAEDDKLRMYADTKEPIGRAGGYAIQSLGTMLVESIEGSYSNVVGLPLEKLSRMFADDFNKPIWNFDKVSKWEFPDSIKGMSYELL